MRAKRRALIVFVGIGLTAGRSVAQSGPTSTTSTRDAALRALASRLDLPLVDEAIRIFSTQLRKTLPSYFVDSIGRQLALGPRWKRGDPAFDQTLRTIDAALAADETRAGPLLRVERSDLLLAVDIPWTVDDIAFIEQMLPTDLGREGQRALDAQAARQVIATLKRRVAAEVDAATIASAFADVDARAQAQFGDASLMLLALRGTDPRRAQRLQRLIEAVTLAPSDAIGQRIVDRLSRRLLEAATAQWPNLIGPVAGFRTGS